MTQHNYTHVIDMSDSEAFYAGFYDDVDKVLYLTFKNGTTSSRQAPAETTPEDVEEVDSWGRQWWATLRDLPEGPRVEPGDEFVYRAEPAAEADAPPRYASGDRSFDRAWEAFTGHLFDEYGWDTWDVEDYEDEYQGALRAAVCALLPDRSEPTETAAPQEQDDLADATRNSEGAFLGIGFTDVPAEVEQRLTSILGFVNEFVRDDLGDGVKGLIQRYDVSQMRDFMRGLR